MLTTGRAKPETAGYELIRAQVDVGEAAADALPRI